MYSATTGSSQKMATNMHEHGFAVASSFTQLATTGLEANFECIWLQAELALNIQILNISTVQN